MSDFEIPKDNYLSFDAFTMKRYITDRLNESGLFTDQNFEGSYLSSINNIIAYTFNSLMFYLNNTSSESLFSEAQIYENMNRIVKMLSYKPIGFQTATLPFTPTVGTLTPGVYFIPRYSYFIKNNISYSFAEDIIFEKTIEGTEVISELSNEKLLLEGRFREYSTIIASGEENEIVNLTTPEDINVDHFNIQVYIKRASSEEWEEWEQTENLYLEMPSAQKFEVRLNENQNYELKFGNNINGAQLEQNDEVAIYYLESNGVAGEVGPGYLTDATFAIFGSTQLQEILADIITEDHTQLPSPSLFTAVNTFASSNAKNIETPDEIRENAPGIFRSQLRLVTKNDFSNYILTNFSNFVHDVYVANNWSFLQERMQYYYDLGLDNPLLDTPILYAHANFADSNNFNNIYITACPKTSVGTTNTAPVLANSQKQSMLAAIQPRKVMTSEVVFLDPVYMAVNIGINDSNANPDVDDINNSVLVIERSENSRRPEANIKNAVIEVITNAFAQVNRNLGDTIDISQITNDILTIDGVSKISTKRTDTGVTVEGLRMIVYNPIYPQDIEIVSNNTQLKNFQFAYFENLDTLAARIEVGSVISNFEGIEY